MNVDRGYFGSRKEDNVNGIAEVTAILSSQKQMKGQSNWGLRTGFRHDIMMVISKTGRNSEEVAGVHFAAYETTINEEMVHSKTSNKKLHDFTFILINTNEQIIL